MRRTLDTYSIRDDRRVKFMGSGGAALVSPMQYIGDLVNTCWIAARVDPLRSRLICIYEKLLDPVG